MFQRCFIAAAMLASMATVAIAQPPGSGGLGGFFRGRARLLVDLPEVRKELGVDEQQAALLDALQEDLAEQRLALREEDEGPRTADDAIERVRSQHKMEELTAFDRRSETLIALVLEPKQAARLSELYLQRDGIRAFERPEVVTKLELSDEQKRRLQSLRETFVENRPRRRTPEQQRELREKEQQALRDLLSEEQQSRWQELLGKPFDFSTIWRRGSQTR